MKITEYSPLALAYVGDARYGLRVKAHVATCEVKMDRMQRHCNKYVSARAQAEIIEHLIANDILTEEEISIYKRGRNSKAHKAPKNTDAVTYHKSTGFEAMWGYLYLTGSRDRLEQLWDIIRTIREE